MEDGGQWESTAVFKKIVGCLEEEDNAEAVKLCDQVLSKIPGDAAALHTKCVCQIHLHAYQQALKTAETAAKQHPSQQLLAERAYCQFKLNQLQQAQKLIDSAGASDTEGANPPLLHLKAQVSYRLNNFSQAAAVYADIATRHEQAASQGGQHQQQQHEDETNFLINTYAVHVSAGRGDACLLEHPPDGLDEEAGGYELLYDVACALIQAKDWGGALASLERAKEVCEESLTEEGCSVSEIEEELTLVRAQTAYVQQQMGRREEALGAYRKLSRDTKNAAVSALALNNLCCMRRSGGGGVSKETLEAFKQLTHSNLPAKKFLPQQLQALRFNQCLAFTAGSNGKGGADEDIDKGLALASELREAYPGSSLPARVQAWVHHSNGRPNEAKQVLEEGLSAVQAGKAGVEDNEEEATRKRKEEYHQLLLDQAQYLVSGGGKDNKRFDEAIDLLRRLEGGLAAHPCTLHTIADMLRHTGRPDEAAEALAAIELGGEGSNARITLHTAEVLLDNGQHAEAARAFEAALAREEELGYDQRVSALAGLVVALSAFDAGRAREVGEDLPMDVFDDIEMPDGEALESVALPRSDRAKRLLLVDKTAHKSERKAASKNPEKVAKKRAARREKYLQKLISEGKIDPSKPMPFPDPERWTSKKQRSYKKRGRNRNKFVGAQGTGSGASKDAAKLDVMARLAAKKDSDKPQPQAKLMTDGLGSGKRGGGKKKKKK